MEHPVALSKLKQNISCSNQRPTSCCKSKVKVSCEEVGSLLKKRIRCQVYKMTSVNLTTVSDFDQILKHEGMLCNLIRIASMRGFYSAHTTYHFHNKKENLDYPKSKTKS